MSYIGGLTGKKVNLIITNSSIGMDSARTYTSVSRDAITYERNVTTLSAKGFMDALNGAYENSDNKKADISDEIKEEKSKKDADTLSDNSEGTLGFLNGKYSEIFTRDITKVTNVSDDTASTLRTMILKLILMLLIGRGDTQDMLNRAFSDEGVSEGELGSALSFTKVTHSLTYERYEAEFEGTTFNAKGVVNTKDGRQIDFGIDISMSRSFEQYVRETGVCETLNARLTDPLVINLDNCAADISDQKFLFDIDADGDMDNISMLGKGSGFLALDQNEDGIINDGSELFGTKSGDGFADLSKYDSDGNGWIDEADEVFDKLSIMCFNEDGSTSLYKLKDKDVGAIYLG
ncbi:MAG: hypothetical protein Q4B53_02750, partial [Lachnospiraceae bacterium]|nr:hypothetical protein [Lachnospiraceae bacterium]